MLIIGHRGAAGLAPENTLKAIRAGIESGVDMIEIDIAVCRTGEVILMHDDKVDSRTGVSGYVADLSYDEIRDLRIDGSEQIPTLQEAIAVIGNQCPLNIEIKGTGSANEVARILRHEIRNGSMHTEDFLVSSYNHRELFNFSELCPGIRIAPIISCYPLKLAELAEEIGAWSLNMKRENVTREIVEDAHERGIRVLVFTVNYPEELERLQELQVDGIFTDNRYRLLNLK